MVAPKNIEDPLYFMDVVMENVRCFKEKQTVDLSNGEGRPAQWTIILGDNGTGKTTLLKGLAFLQPKEDELISIMDDVIRHFIIPIGGKISELSKNFFLGLNGESAISTNKFFIGNLSSIVEKYIDGYGFKHRGKSCTGRAINYVRKKNIFIIAYGASRKMGTGSLTESRNPFPMATLFDENASLINAEAWLLETDFAIKNAKGETKKYLQNHYKKVKETLQNLLPDVEDFRIREITKTQTQAAIEVKTPYGWVAMKNLSLGYQSFIA